MSDPILAALADTQRRLAAAKADAENQRRLRHHTEQLLDQAHHLIADQHRQIENLARPVAA